MRTKVTVKSGLMTLASVEGIPMSSITLEEARKIIDIEQFLERLTGYRFHIDIIEETLDDQNNIP